jgi:hypothetical protein
MEMVLYPSRCDAMDTMPVAITIAKYAGGSSATAALSFSLSVIFMILDNESPRGKTRDIA